MRKYVDIVFNLYINIKNWIMYNIFCNLKGDFTIPTNYTLNYFDDFGNMSEEELNKKYIKSQFWGDYHPNDLQQWYDPNAVSLSNGALNLSATQNTKQVTSYYVNGQLKENQPPKTILNGVGLVTSMETFRYGIFEWNIRLPKGSGLWPAVWMSGKETWPPEIDVIEGYSNSKGRYKRNLNTNIHCGSKSENHYGLGANRHGLFIKSDKNLTLTCHWTKDFIRIYYNGFLCRQITNPKDLIWFNQDMVVIMNQALRREIVEKTPFNNVAITPLKIFNFKYYKLIDK